MDAQDPASTLSPTPTPVVTPEVVSPASSFSPQTLAVAAFSFAALLVARASASIPLIMIIVVTRTCGF
jgi:hypothetical protein